MRFSYAFTLRWHGDTLRLMLPTVIAPRYNTSPLAPHQQPVVSLAVENHFTLELDVRGALARAQFCSPSHDLTVVPHVDGIRLALDRQAVVMDRDFVLNVKLPQAPRAFAQQDSDVGRQLVMASFVPFFPGLRAPRPLELAVVVDCSGSMAGDSITQAKRALESMLDALSSDDRLTLIAFGNTTHALCDQPQACDAHHLAAARRFVAGLDANLGGTQIAAALHTAYQALRDTRAGDIFLVTDGEVADWARVVDEARVTGHRLFTVGVGSAVAESFVRRLARDTGGACELVAPREGMTEKVLRHFERMRATLHWPAGAVDVFPAQVGPLFEGDTVFAHARLPAGTGPGEVTLEIETEDGQVATQTLPVHRARTCALLPARQHVDPLAGDCRAHE